MKVVAFLPAKGSSERIENKNTRLLDGKPLFLHTLEKLVKCGFIDEVYLDSEADEIFELASEVECRHLKRDPALATNKTDGHALFMNEVRQVQADIYIQILGTSPFIKPETIKRGIDALIENGEYDSAVLVAQEKQYLWENNQPKYDKFHIPNSKDLPDTIVESMGLYIVKRETALKTKRRYGDNVYFLYADSIEKVDVNYPDDFVMANYLAAGMREKEREFFRNLSTILTSSILADILNKMHVRGVIKGLNPNLTEVKILGRANTLKLRKLKDGESFTGIYDALKSYKTIIPGDVIVVENECPDYAYFGNLNASLAIRAGANAAIIDGVTRDYNAVKSLRFPVFAKGYSCDDVLGRATTGSINKTIKISGVAIHPGELVFADNDGVVVIPERYEKIVLEQALDVIKKENQIIGKIIFGTDAMCIVEEIGAF